MAKFFLFILISLNAFAQQMDYKSISDDQLKHSLENELLDMEKMGATSQSIFEKFVMETDAYIMSRESYYRFVVHLKYTTDKLLTKDVQNGSDAAKIFEIIEKMKHQKSYQDYVDSRRTDKAKEHWENSTQDGILKLVVDDFDQFTEAEQKRYDGLIILLDRDPYFTHLNITDGKTTKKIMPNIN
ncbi:hypothetical protein [Gelidibacter maritimus]|uniref:Uncharacterized protein n=1 Tax=Gelidibacter maritimus TaxID=2761487 RepID=A0A7W2R3U2_9FLAO|nr:hypothetical protein [Gelidibacter maritimus]MBA6153149.1 hypothetical protein [Gelidibacter maritimus]